MLFRSPISSQPGETDLSPARIWSPLAPKELRIEAWEALGLPGTHYAAITRGVFLPGVGLSVLWPNTLMLIGLGLAFTGLAALFFRKKLA